LHINGIFIFLSSKWISNYENGLGTRNLEEKRKKKKWRKNGRKTSG